MYFLRSQSGKIHALGKSQKPIEVQPIECPQDFNFQGLLAQAYLMEDAAFLEGEQAEPWPQATGTVGGGLEKGMTAGGLEGYKAEDGLADQEAVGMKRDYGVPRDGNKAAGLKRTYMESFPQNSDVSRSHRRRREKRNAQIMAQGHLPNSKALSSVLLSSEPVQTDLETSKLPTTSCGFQSLPYRPKAQDVIDKKIKDLQSKGYLLIPSDSSVPRPILDHEKRIIGAFCGRLDDPEYLEACAQAYDLFEDVGKNPDLMDESVNNRRGSFPVINIGVTHGKGTCHPINLHEGKDKPSKYEDTVRRILQSPALNRIAVFQSSCFKMWSPHVYQHYHQNLNDLYAERPNLRRNFPKSVFPSCAVNCGPKAWTRPHRDTMNLPFGMCAITALGDFDHRKGGHLILPDLKLILEFPVGSVILIPSATLVHANIGVDEHERRASFTQFAAGGLFRYIENNFMTEKALKLKDKQKYASVCARKKTRWAEGLNLLSKISDLVDKQ